METQEERQSAATVNQACLVCRSRKVKCDKTVPSCHKCTRLGIQCPGYDAGVTKRSKDDVHSSVEVIYHNAGIKRRRLGSCKECHNSKNKCSRDRPRCQRCVQKSLPCTYSRHDAQHQEDSRSHISPSASSEDSPGAARSSNLTQSDDQIHWLRLESLPTNYSQLKLLVDLYFDRISPLRCFGFLHKPSFMQSLDRGSIIEEYGEALVLIICALGARVYFSDNVEQFRSNLSAAPGQAWAEKSQALVMKEILSPSLKTLMTMILISEYATRIDEHALAFTIWGCAYQIMRLLGLDSDATERYNNNTSRTVSVDHTQKESERRLLWSCFVLDSFIGSGIDENLRWRGNTPRAPLPCSDHNFLEQTQPPDMDLRTIETLSSPNILRKSDLRSQVIYLSYMRTQVLRLIRSNDQLVPIWHSHSSFLQLIQQLDIWYNNIPNELMLTDLNMYIQKELNIIGAVFMLHFFYHTVVCDLTRTSLPGYDFPLASAFRHAPMAFRRQCQERCRFHANEIARLIRIGLSQGRCAFDDLHCMMAAFESVKIQIVHTAIATSNSPADRIRAAENIRVNMAAIDLMHLEKDKPNLYHRRLLPLLTKFGFDDIVSEWGDASLMENDELIGPPEAGYLSSLAQFRIAKSVVQAQQHTSPQQLLRPSNDDIRNPLPPSQVPPAISAVHSLMEETLPPQELSSALSDANQGSQDFYPSSGNIPLQNNDLLDQSEFSVQDYIQLAEEMSTYITWDLSIAPN
ncbi:hypothetical protein F5884DRAFT_316685 [Xylogone sp. PMI_703]|nr:hypothetical protein F5884DRAFT_316685 [Xylogone sp. PMI_703]